MISLLLGRNGRLLMPILALLLMNLPVAEAKFEWPEGTMGNFAMVGLVFTAITTGSGFISTFVYLYRKLVGIPHQSHTETDRRLRESKEWLEYIRWNATQNPTTHPLHEGAAARVLDLEKQLYEEPPPTRALPVRIFKCLIRTAKRCYASATSGGNSTNENSGDKGRAPEHRILPHPLLGFKIGAYHTIYPATATYRPRKSAAARRSRKKSARRHRSARIVREPGEIGIHYASYKPRGASRKSAHKTKSTTTKGGGKISAYDRKGRSRKPIHKRRAAINSFRRLLRAAKNGFAPPTIITSDDLTIKNTHLNKGKVPEGRVPPPPQILAFHRHGHRHRSATTPAPLRFPAVHRHRHRHRSATTIKDGVMNVTQGSAKSAHRRSSKPAHGHGQRSATHHPSKSAHQPRKSTHRHRSAIHHSARRRSRSLTRKQKLAKILRGHFHAAKNGLITLGSGDGSNKSRLDKGKAPEPRIPPESEIPTAHRHRHRHRSKHATTKDGIKTRTHRHHHHTCSKARSKHATTKDGIKTRTHHRHHHHHHTCSKARSKHATTKDGIKTRTHRHHHQHPTYSKARSKHATAKDGSKPRTHRHHHHTCSKARSKHATNKDGSKARTHRHQYHTCSKARFGHATTKDGSKPRTHRRQHHACSKARRRSRRSTQKDKLAKIFPIISRAAKNGLITLASGDGSTKSRLDKGKAPEPRIPPESEITTAHKHRHRHRPKHATTKDGIKTRTHRHHHHTHSKARSKHATTKDGGGKSRTHRHHQTCSKARSKHATTKDGDKRRKHRRHHRSLIHSADKPHEGWNQHDVIAPLPQAHTSPHHHTHLGPSKPLIRFALDPIRPPCQPHRARKPFQSGAPTSVFDLFKLLSRNKPVSPSGGSISGFDRPQRKSRKRVPLAGAPDFVRYKFEPEYHTPVPSPKSSSIPGLSHAISRKPVPPPGTASVSVLDLSQPISRKPVPSTTAPPSRAHLSYAISCKPVPPPSGAAAVSVDGLSDPESRNPVSSPPATSSSILNSFDTVCRKPVFYTPLASSSSILNSSDTVCRKPVFYPPPAFSSSIVNSSGTVCRKPVLYPPASSNSILNSSDTVCRKPVSVSPSDSFGVPDISHGACRRGLGWYEKEDERIP